LPDIASIVAQLKSISESIQEEIGRLSEDKNSIPP
jgi:hypothetical protein